MIINFNSLPTCPPAFKSINPYLQRAKEMEKFDPVISYWCAFHAAQTCMSIGHSEPQSREFLMRLLDLLEHAKGQLADNDAITNNLAATAYVENFALKIFDGADKDDQQGLSTRPTAQRFLAAACFLEVLQSLTNQPEPDILQKIKYAKWKAASISKALREGPSEVQPTDSNNRRPSSISIDPIQQNLNGLPDTPLPTSTEIPDGLNDWPTDLAAHSMKKLPSPISRPKPLNSAGSSSSTHPNPFPSTVFPPSIQSTSVIAPVPSDFITIPSPPSSAVNHNLNPISPPNPPNPSISSAIEHHQVPQSDPTGQPVQQQTFYSTSSNLHHPTTANPTNNLPTISGSDVYASMTTRSTGSAVIDPLKVSKAQKHAKWAISALNFDDILTARKELQTALDTLNSF